MPKQSYKKVNYNTLFYLITAPILLSFLMLIFIVYYYSLVKVSFYQEPFAAVVGFVLIAGLYVNAFLEYVSKGYYFSVNSFTFKQGFWNSKNVTIPFTKVSHCSLNQTIFQKVYGICTIKFEQIDDDEYFNDISVNIGTQILQKVSEKSGITKVA